MKWCNRVLRTMDEIDGPCDATFCYQSNAWMCDMPLPMGFGNEQKCTRMSYAEGDGKGLVTTDNLGDDEIV